MLNLRGIVMWAGTEQSLEGAQLAQERMNALDMAAFSSERGAPDPFIKAGDVAIVPVRGPLVNIDSPILAFFGVASYPSIRRSLVAAASDPTVKQILLDVDSGGGAVSGAQDTSDLIARINAKIKPVTTFTGGTMASAAYWLGSAAGEVIAAPTAVVGSIGVLAVHIDRTKMFQDAGMKPTVMRSVPNKARVNPFEELTAEVKAEVERQLMAVHKVFTQNVGDARGMTPAAVDAKGGQGGELIGADAQAAGFVDGLGMFDAVLSKLQNGKKTVDKAAAIYDNGIIKRSNSMKQSSTLTDQEIAALAEGASLVAVTAEASAASATLAVAEVVAAAATAAVKTEVAAAGTEVVAAAATAAVKTEAAAAGTELVTFLQAQVKEKDGQLLALQIELKGLKDKAVEIEATHAPLSQLARDSIGRMQVALGGTAADLTALTSVAVLAEHTRVLGLFTAKFKVGGVAAVSAVAAQEKKSAPVDANHTARVKATRLA